MVTLGECGTRTTFDAVIGAYTTPENTLAVELVGRLQRGTLCVADRGFYSFEAWQKASSTGADLLWRVKDNLKLDPIRDLPDGSWLAEVFHSTRDRHRREPTTVRVIEYMIDDGREPVGPVRLITTIRDHRKAPAIELACAYAERWEIETAFDELKTHQRGPTGGAALQVTRTRHPGDLGPPVLPLRHPHADVRSGRPRRPRPRSGQLRRRVAHHAPAPSPNRARFPPQTTDTTDRLWRHAIRELIVRLLPHRRPRANPHVVKRKYTRWHVKRARHRNWPQPNRPPEQAVRIT